LLGRRIDCRLQRWCLVERASGLEPQFRTIGTRARRRGTWTSNGSSGDTSGQAGSEHISAVERHD
jgi:hypothetical protein